MRDQHERRDSGPRRSQHRARRRVPEHGPARSRVRHHGGVHGVRAGVRQRHALNVGVPLSPLYPRQLPGRHLSHLRRLVREYNRGGVQVQVRRRRVRRPLPVQGHERRWACWGAQMGGIDARLAHRDVLLLKRLRNVH